MSEAGKQKMLPCPFCGIKPKVYRYLFGTTTSRPSFSIKCVNPECDVQPVVVSATGADAVFEKWNRQTVLGVMATVDNLFGD